MKKFTNPDRQSSIFNVKGFTLIEVLVSASIIVIIFSFIFGVFFNILHGKERGEEAGDIYQNIRIIFNILEKDIRSATLFKYNNDNSYFIGEDREEGGASMDTIRFTSLSSHDFMNTISGINQNMIEYLPLYDRDTERVTLYRNEISILIEESFKEENRVNLCDSLYGINYRFLSGDSWTDVWDSSGGNRLPKAVEIEIVLLDRNDNKISFVDVVRIETSPP